MAFLKRKEVKYIDEKKPVADGAWIKCDSCGEILYRKEVQLNLNICHKCGYHFRVNSNFYKKLLLDDGLLNEHDQELTPTDFLKFKDYPAKIKKSKEKTGLNDAIICGEGKINGIDVEVCLMEFEFIGGSMGSIVGEKVKRAIYRAIEKDISLIIVNASGGARMQEGIMSLMQMAKTSTALNLLKKPFISILTNPTTAGVMASYASLGDIIISEPDALLGFAGPRVIQQTIKQELPEGFQRSEFMLEHGMIDMIVPRNQMKEIVTILLKHLS